MQSGDIRFTIAPSQVLRFLMLVTAILVVLSTAGQAIVYFLPDLPLRDGIANLFYVGWEQNLPTLFSTMLLLLSALLFEVIAHAHRRAGGNYVRHWGVLSLVFLLLAFDEFGSVHEQATRRLRSLFDIQGGPFRYAWVIPAGAAVLLLGAVLLRFLRHLPRPTRRRLWLAAVLFLSGALGLELVEGAYSSIHGKLNIVYVVMITVEETLEMLGLAVLVYALLAYIPVGFPDVGWRLRIGTGDSGEGGRPLAGRSPHEV